MRSQAQSLLFDASLLSLRREDHDLALDEVIVDEVEELEGVDVWVHEDRLDLGDPFIHLAGILVCESVLLVCPVSCDTFLCDLMHALASDLYLYPDTGVTHESTVESLVSVALRCVDPVSDAVVLVFIYA